MPSKKVGKNGIALKAADGSGSSFALLNDGGFSGVLQVLDSQGAYAEVHLGPDELRELGKALLRLSSVALAKRQELTEVRTDDTQVRQDVTEVVTIG